MRSGSAAMRAKETVSVLPELVAQNSVAAAVDQQVPDAIVDAVQTVDGPVFFVAPALIAPVCRALKELGGFDQVTGITGVDWWPQEPRFEVVYFLRSYQRSARLRFNVRLAEGEEIDSICSVWRGANWYEREVFDLFGVVFRNHPNLERIMMPSDWEGYPLRKDYPVHGHKYSYQDE
jgi:NADH-quinone oxidoreductase subunit C